MKFPNVRRWLDDARLWAITVLGGVPYEDWSNQADRTLEALRDLSDQRYYNVRMREEMTGIISGLRSDLRSEQAFTAKLMRDVTELQRAEWSRLRPLYTVPTEARCGEEYDPYSMATFFRVSCRPEHFVIGLRVQKDPFLKSSTMHAVRSQIVKELADKAADELRKKIVAALAEPLNVTLSTP